MVFVSLHDFRLVVGIDLVVVVEVEDFLVVFKVEDFVDPGVVDFVVDVGDKPQVLQDKGQYAWTVILKIQ